MAEGQQQQPDMTDVLQQLVQGIATINDRLAAVETKVAAPPAPTKEVVQPPVVPPTPPANRSTADMEAYQRKLTEYAAQQARAAAQYRVAIDFGVDPKELEGDFADEPAMRRYAKQLKDLADLRKIAEEAQAKITQLTTPIQTTPVGEPPIEDTGGQTGQRGSSEADLDKMYADLKQGRPTDAARAKYLSTIYLDPRKIIGKGPRPNTPT